MSLRVAFLYPPGAFGPNRVIPWDDVEGFPLTGTDQIALMYPREMAKRGHHVDLYIERAPSDPHTFWEGVEIRPWNEWEYFGGKEYEAVIAASYPEPLTEADSRSFRMVNRQVAKFVKGTDWEPHYDDAIDLYTCPSKTALEVVSTAMGSFSSISKFRVLHNGHTPPTGNEGTKIHGRCVYISSPDRGLHLLLQEWPRIKKAVPHATLGVYYHTLKPWLEHYCDPHKQANNALEAEVMRRAHYTAHALQKLKAYGVETLGGVSHRELQTVLAQAEVLPYPMSPLSFTETFGCAVLEACAHGALPIISTADAFGELWSEACPHVAHPVQKNIAVWRDLVILALKDQEWRDKQVENAKRHAARMTWETQTDQLEAMLTAGVEAKHRPVSVTTNERPTLHMVLTRYGQGAEKIDVLKPFDRSTGGGAPTEFMGLALEMPKLGWDVTVYADFVHPHAAGDGIVFKQRDPRWDGTEIQWAWFAPPKEPDVALAFYDTRPLPVMPARKRVACHLTFMLPFPDTARYAHLQTAPSDYAVAELKRLHPELTQWATLPNSVIPDLKPWRPVHGRVLSHTSVDRGLHHLVGAWPMVRRAVPDATLHIVGPVEEWITSQRMAFTPMGDQARKLSRVLPAAMDAGGVELLGRLPRGQLVDELAEASCFCFPCDPISPCETFSRSTMEALAQGIPCVLCQADAMQSLYYEVAWFTNKNPHDIAHDLTRVLDDEYPVTLQRDGGLLAAQHTFEANARKLDKALRGIL